jgi:hypothetical protein
VDTANWELEPCFGCRADTRAPSPLAWCLPLLGRGHGRPRWEVSD